MAGRPAQLALPLPKEGRSLGKSARARGKTVAEGQPGNVWERLGVGKTRHPRGASAAGPPYLPWIGLGCPPVRTPGKGEASSMAGGLDRGEPRRGGESEGGGAPLGVDRGGGLIGHERPCGPVRWCVGSIRARTTSLPRYHPAYPTDPGFRASGSLIPAGDDGPTRPVLLGCRRCVLDAPRTAVLPDAPR